MSLIVNHFLVEFTTSAYAIAVMPGCAEGTSGEASFVAISEQIQTGQNQTVNAIDEVQPPTSDGPVALPVELASASPMLTTLSGGTPTLIGGVVGGEMPNTFGFVASDSNSSGTVSGERDQETATNGNGAGSQAAASESGSEENGGRGRRNVGQCTI